MQPAGYVHSLGFVDPARFIRHQLRRFGVEVTIAKNRVRADAVNLVLGAHLGFPPEWRERHACLFVNLEQLGPGGAKVSEDYLRLLKTSGVVDYDLTNVGAYGADPADVPLLPFRHAAYLEPRSLVLEERPIDLLFFGSLNERRRRFIARVEACGHQVAMFDRPLYGEERDRYIRQSKAVLNCHFYDSATFEQVRAFHCLSLGTPVIAERSAQTRPDDVFEDAVTWVDEQSLEAFFGNTFGTPGFYEQCRAQLLGWRQHDPVEAYADLMAFSSGFFQAHASHRPEQSWTPSRINIGSGKDYKPGWLNLDIIDRAEPDVVLDLGRPQAFPIEVETRFGVPLELQAGSVEKVYANNVLEHVPDLTCLMTNVLTLLKEGGEIEIEVPYEKALTAWQDPTHLRAMNENSWIYYTEWFWYLGWFEHRFELKEASWLDSSLKPCAKDQAAFMRVRMEKACTTDAERTTARTMQADLRIDDDLVFPSDTPLAAEQSPCAPAHLG
jgi:SAM-dependent methyltransferase